MAIKEGKWRCPACDAVNLGRDMKCNSCGTVRGEDVQFFLDGSEEEIQDESLLQRAQAGTDWHCDFCGTDNPANQEKCRQCGASMEGMKRRQQSLDPLETQEAVPPTPSPQKKGGPLKLLVPLILIVFAGLLFFLTRGKEETLRVQEGQWVRTIAIEKKQWVTYEAWYDQLPAEGEILRSWEEQRSTERIQVGTETVKTGTRDLGNGFFEDVYEERPIYEENPIYDTKVEYRILQWRTHREVARRGGLTEPPVWPEFILRDEEREGPHSEEAVIYFISTDPELEDTIFSYNNLSPEELSQFQVNDEFQAIVAGDRVRRLLEE